MKNVILFLFVFLSAAFAMAGDKEGNGGDAVVCFKSPATKTTVEALLRYNQANPKDPKNAFTDESLADIEGKVRLLDLYEAGFSEDSEVEHFITPQNTVKETLENRLQVLKRQYGFFGAKIYEIASDRLPYDHFRILDGGVVEINDSHQAVIPREKCLVAQIAIQKQMGNHYEVTVDRRLFDRMNLVHRTALFFHEWIYNLGIEIGHTNSISSRRMNELLFRRQFEKMKLEEIAKVVNPIFGRRLEYPYKNEYSLSDFQFDASLNAPVVTAGIYTGSQIIALAEDLTMELFSGGPKILAPRWTSSYYGLNLGTTKAGQLQILFGEKAIRLNMVLLKPFAIVPGEDLVYQGVYVRSDSIAYLSADRKSVVKQEVRRTMKVDGFEFTGGSELSYDDKGSLLTATRAQTPDGTQCESIKRIGPQKFACRVREQTVRGLGKLTATIDLQGPGLTWEPGNLLELKDGEKLEFDGFFEGQNAKFVWEGGSRLELLNLSDGKLTLSKTTSLPAVFATRTEYQFCTGENQITLSEDRAIAHVGCLGWMPRKKMKKQYKAMGLKFSGVDLRFYSSGKIAEATLKSSASQSEFGLHCSSGKRARFSEQGKVTACN